FLRTWCEGDCGPVMAGRRAMRSEDRTRARLRIARGMRRSRGSSPAARDRKTTSMTAADDSMQPYRFSPAIDAVLAAAPPMPLDGGTVDAPLAEKLRALDLAALFAASAVRDSAAARACLAGLWLRANDLPASHRISQELHTPEGSF